MSSSGEARRATRLVVESLVIIASILAAFALDTWWDGVQEREEERETLVALGVEFRGARAELLDRRMNQERILAAVAAITDSLHRAVESGRPVVALPDTLLSLAYIPPTTSLGLGTLHGMIGSGRLGLIRDRDLRGRLGAWGVELDELREEELDSRALAYGDLDRTLRSRMSTYGLWPVGDSLFKNQLEGERPLRVVPADTEVLGVFHLRTSVLSHGVEEFEPLIAAVDSILVLIERNLAS